MSHFSSEQSQNSFQGEVSNNTSKPSKTNNFIVLFSLNKSTSTC